MSQARTILVNGAARTTTFVSSTTLTTQLTPADLATAGTLAVSVSTPTPGGGTSGTLSFSVTNQVPVATSLSPASATAGSAATTVTITGSAFLPTSTVLVNGATRTPTNISATSLTFQLTATDLATAGTIAIAVSNPAPGGGVSSALTFTVNNPAPVLTSISPTSATVGSGTTTLAVTGSAFVSGLDCSCQRHAPDHYLPLRYLAHRAVDHRRPHGDVALLRSRSATLLRAVVCRTRSTFAVNNPAPVISSLSPASATAGSGATTLTVNGSAFVNGASVVVNGTARTTTFVSGTTLTIQLQTADLATAGTLTISVSNPAPGGGVSSALTFTINNPAPVAASLNPSSALVGSGAQNRRGQRQRLHCDLFRSGQRCHAHDDVRLRDDAQRATARDGRCNNRHTRHHRQSARRL